MDTYLAAIEAELQSWPGTDHHVERRSKHRTVRLTYGRNRRSLVIPTTGSDHRGPKNAVTQLRRTLKDMGATKLAERPATKRGKKQAEANAAAVARLGVNNSSVVFAVSKHSPLYDRFVKRGETQHYWSLELRAVPDPKGAPHLAIVMKEPPTEKMHPGVAKGFINKQTESYSLAILRNQFKAMDRLGPFASQPIELVEDKGDVLLFKLPANRKPLSRQPAVPAAPPPSHEPSHEPEVILAETIHPPAARRPEPEPAAAPQPTPLVIQAPREKVSLEKAINVINAYKEKMGDNLRLSIAEGGYLTVIAKMGRR